MEKEKFLRVKAEIEALSQWHHTSEYVLLYNCQSQWISINL